MLSRIRKRFTYTNMIMTVALVFAMTGGAYAASKVLITSTKQISPKVLKALKGANGAKGAQGPAGPAGATGPAGPAGKEGSTGKEGKEGPAGKEGKEGSAGKNGTNGTTGFTEMLPSGKTETGEFADAVEQPVEGGQMRYAISFPIPLAATAVPHFIGEEEGEGEPKEKLPAGCKGKAEKPEAEAGNLCVFVKVMQAAKFVTFQDGGSASTSATGLTGDGFLFNTEHVEPFSGFVETAQFLGTWAVTAE